MKIIKQRYANAKQIANVVFGDDDRQWTFKVANAIAVLWVLPGFYGALPRTWYGRPIWRPYSNV